VTTLPTHIKIKKTKAIEKVHHVADLNSQTQWIQ